MPIFQKPDTSRPAKGHKTYPYLLGSLRVERPNQVWCADITYLPMRRGFSGTVVGIDMTPEMLEKSRATARAMNTQNVEFREGLLEDLPVEDDWADVVISNGVINLCPDKKKVLAEAQRVLRPGGVLQFADIANGAPVPQSAISNIDLWTA